MPRFLLCPGIQEPAKAQGDNFAGSRVFRRRVGSAYDSTITRVFRLGRLDAYRFSANAREAVAVVGILAAAWPGGVAVERLRLPIAWDCCSARGAETPVTTKSFGERDDSCQL